MNNVEYLPTNSPTDAIVNVSDWAPSEKTYRFHILILKEDNDTISIIALNLPGVMSMGETEAEAMSNFKEAALMALEEYEESGTPIPWKIVENDDDIPPGSLHKWIIVNGQDAEGQR